MTVDVDDVEEQIKMEKGKGKGPSSLVLLLRKEQTARLTLVHEQKVIP